MASDSTQEAPASPPSDANGHEPSLEAQAEALSVSKDTNFSHPVIPSNTALPAEQQAQLEAEPDAEASPPDDMDAIVEGLLIAGLHQLDDEELPVQTNDFYSKTVLGCKPSGKNASRQQPVSVQMLSACSRLA